MADKLWFLIPEMILFAGAVAVSVLGLARSKSARDLSPLVVCVSLALAALVTPFLYADTERLANAGLLMPMLGKYVKIMVPLIGIVLTMLCVGMVDRNLEGAFGAGRAPFDPIRVARGEFYAFFLLSIMGVLLCCNANDLIWLFLALELTSLPTYVMVATARGQRRGQEAAVKYFFLGAMAAAIFLFGFAFIYGATGTLVLGGPDGIAAAFREQQLTDGGVNAFGVIGIVLAILGISFKIASVPMHFYAADVYEGAPAPVTAFLAFVPKTAGMLSIMLLLGTIGWTDGRLPHEILVALWTIAVLTMTVGNVLALLQRSIKRILAYSSIAHSGYMLIGIIAGPKYGLPAVLFYLFAYGVMNTAAFAVLAALERKGEEVEHIDDLAGLRVRHPALATVMAISCISLIGFPPMIGFVGKLGLFVAGVEGGQIALVVIAGLNSAISAWYYLKLAGLPILSRPTPRSDEVERVPSRWPFVAAVICAVGVATIWIYPGPVLHETKRAMEGYGEANDGAFDIVVTNPLNPPR